MRQRSRFWDLCIKQFSKSLKPCLALDILQRNFLHKIRNVSRFSCVRYMYLLMYSIVLICNLFVLSRLLLLTSVCLFQMPEIELPHRVRCGTDMPGYGLNNGLCADIAYGLENVSVNNQYILIRPVQLHARCFKPYDKLYNNTITSYIHGKFGVKWI